MNRRTTRPPQSVRSLRRQIRRLTGFDDSNVSLGITKKAGNRLSCFDLNFEPIVHFGIGERSNKGGTPVPLQRDRTADLPIPTAIWSQLVGSGCGAASEVLVSRPAEGRRLVPPLARA